jgi:flagellar biosynthesis protein FlhF
MDQTNSSMRIKSFFAGSVEKAIQEARLELGPDAMLITSRRSSPEARSLGAYEVVFGLQGSAPRTRAATAAPAELSSELQQLRAQLQEIKSTLQGTRSAGTAGTNADELLAELVSLDFSRTVASELVLSAEIPAASYVADAISRRIPVATEIQKEIQQPGNVIVFAGPAGAGKTTTLIKIAIREALAHRLPVRILSLDPYRVAAHEKLRSFAAIVGVGFAAINSVQEFAPAVEEARLKSIVLVDTPGFGPSELGAARDIAACLPRTSNRRVHLVLPASMNRGALERCICDFAEFLPDYLLFTKLDESNSHGAILSAALEAGKPLSFFTRGQNIPEDLELASPDALIATLFRRDSTEAVSAA